MAPPVGMPVVEALVGQAALRARWARMPRHSSVALAALAATPGLLVPVRRVRRERLAPSVVAMAALAARAALAERVAIAAPAALAAVVVPVQAAAVAWA